MPCSDSDQSRIEWIGVLHELTRTITRNRPGHGTTNPSVIDVEFVRRAKALGLMEFSADSGPQPRLTPFGVQTLAMLVHHFRRIVDQKDREPC